MLSMPVPIGTATTNNSFMAGYGQPPSQAMLKKSLGLPPPSEIPDFHPDEPISGVGMVVFLRKDCGILNTSHGPVVFERKEFCDQNVTDLTVVLRVGCILRFQATPSSYSGTDIKSLVDVSAMKNPETPRYLASFVSPMGNRDMSPDKTSYLKGLLRKLEDCMDTSAEPDLSLESRSEKREQYCLEDEKRALAFILDMFVTNGSPKLPMDDFHTFVSNSPEHRDLYHYIGVNKNKRRCFLENRSHIFAVLPHDENYMYLVHPAIYSVVLTLSNYLLEHGGAMLLQDLFEFYVGCAQVPIEARDVIGEGKNKFLGFLDGHPWIFGVFPSRVFVSIRHRIAKFDYAQICEDTLDIDSFFLPTPMSPTKPQVSPPGPLAGPPPALPPHLRGPAPAGMPPPEFFLAQAGLANGFHGRNPLEGMQGVRGGPPVSAAPIPPPEAFLKNPAMFAGMMPPPFFPPTGMPPFVFPPGAPVAAAPPIRPPVPWPAPMPTTRVSPEHRETITTSVSPSSSRGSSAEAAPTPADALDHAFGKSTMKETMKDAATSMDGEMKGKGKKLEITKVELIIICDECEGGK